jgi:hypothetical protein
MTATSTTILGISQGPFEVVGYTFTDALTKPDVPPPHLLPAWIESTVTRLSVLEGLTPGWDADGGLPVNRVHANRAVRFLERFMADWFPLPDVVPLADGGVQLEWHWPSGRFDFVTDSESPEPGAVLTQRPGRDVEEIPVRELSDDDIRARFIALSGNVSPSA